LAIAAKVPGLFLSSEHAIIPLPLRRAGYIPNPNRPNVVRTPFTSAIAVSESQGS
jgi:hypothetical protein